MTRKGKRRQSAFTLIEILLVIALIALLSAVLLPAAGSLFRGAKGESIDDTIADTMQAVRRQAVLSGREVEFGFDAEQHRFVWSGGGDVGERAVVDRSLSVDFLRPREGGAVLIGGQLVETGVVPRMIFHPDGTCEAMRLQLRSGDREPRVITIDPWTCAPGLEPKS